MGIDANAHIGAEECPAAGPCEPQVTNENGAALCASAEEGMLSIVNTFFPAGPTWTGSTGNRSRIDYLCVSSTVFEAIEKCWVCHDIDLATAVRDDHNVLALQSKDFGQVLFNQSDDNARVVLLKEHGAIRWPPTVEKKILVTFSDISDHFRF